MAEKRHLGYCGMYCGDCLGMTGVIAEAAHDFLDILDKYEFEKTALGVFPEKLDEYDKLVDMLMFMENLKCTRFCREIDGGESTCDIRQCCVENGYITCNSCNGFENCDKLENVLGELHLEACKKNLRDINKMGLEKWLVAGKKHHYWDRDVKELND
ncbi:DUF3795 domain-containing protein [Candidatus Bathyarchaeota archaeon]|nr:MAG: DUF3795 domain-containing protein [Candidatus Bathyarchaeota archaeon]